MNLFEQQANVLQFARPNPAPETANVTPISELDFVRQFIKKATREERAAILNALMDAVLADHGVEFGLQDAAERINAAESDDEPKLCSRCNGSGEGMHDGTRCWVCKGSGAEDALIAETEMTGRKG